jgi:diaminopimelate epimerase
MCGPAEPVFDGVLAPEIGGIGEDLADQPPAPVQAAPSAPAPADPASPSADADQDAATPIDCVTACVDGCQRPEACPREEARLRVEALLNSRSLDDLVALAAQSQELRSRARLDRDSGGPDAGLG